MLGVWESIFRRPFLSSFRARRMVWPDVIRRPIENRKKSRTVSTEVTGIS
jgi:hypothetical protein